MSEDRAFIDTNIIVYLFSATADDIEKRNRSYKAINNYDCQISTQVINEFIHVCIIFAISRTSLGRRILSPR
jgi:predicted nucleic acid-binding protein